MQLLSRLFFGFFFIAAAQSEQPGQCEKNSECRKTYACISMRTNRNGVTKAAQCTPPEPCAGLRAGLCPSFVGWSAKYREITGVCGLVQPNNCRTPKHKPDDDSVVDCQTIDINNQTLSVIYQCMDAKLYKDDQFGFNYTSTQLKSCKSASGEGVCNGHGTCSPVSEFSMDYKCKCYVGYEDGNNCFKAVSNGCAVPGQCGQMGKCDLDKQECECKKGFTGNQCGECSTSVPKDQQCNGNGVCGTDGTCTCNEGFKAPFCGSVSADSPAVNLTPTAFLLILSMICMLF